MSPEEQLAAWQEKRAARFATLPSPCTVAAMRRASIRWSQPDDARGLIRSRATIAINAGLTAEWNRPLTPSVGVILYVRGAVHSGSVRSYRPLTTRLCAASSACVMALEYRRPPEVPFPAPLDDVLAALRWLPARQHPMSSVIIAADSFGAMPALAAIMRRRDAGLPLPRGLYLLCPDADWSNRAFLQSRPLNANPRTCATDQALNQYFRHPRFLCTSPEATPGLQSLAGLPSILMHETAMKPLAHALQLRDRLLAEPSVDFTFRDWPNVPHVWPIYGNAFTYGAEAITHAAAWIKQRLS